METETNLEFEAKKQICEIGKRIYDILRILNHCQIIKWLDKKALSLAKQDLPVSLPEEIIDVCFDYVLIGIVDIAIARDVQVWLEEKGIPTSKILFIETAVQTRN